MRKRMYVLFLSVVLLFSDILPVIGAEKWETDYGNDELSFEKELSTEIVTSASTKLDELINCIKQSDKEDEDGNKYIYYSDINTSSDSAVVSYESQVVFVESLNKILFKNETSVTQAFSKDTFNSEVEYDVTNGVADKMHIYRMDRSGTILVSGNTIFKMNEIDESSIFVFTPVDSSYEISDSDNELFSTVAKRSFEFWDTCMIQGADGISLKDIGFSSWGKGKLLHSGECGDDAKWELRKNGNGDQILYISGSGKMKNYDSYPDTAKAPWANYEINHLIVEDGVTSIGNRAMNRQTKLKSVSMGSTVKTIGEWCFYECSSLSSVTLSEGLTTIGDAAFWDCVGIREITIPGKVKNISSSAFDGCANLETIKLSEGIKEIANHTFADLSSLETLYLPKSLETIGNFAFDGCTSLETINYAGTEDDWDEIDIGGENDALYDAEMIYTKEESKNPNPDNPETPDNPDNPDNPSNPDKPTNPEQKNPDPSKPDNGNSASGKEAVTPEISVSDNKAMDYKEETRGSFTIGYNHSIPFWGKSKVTLVNFGKITLSPNSASSENQISYDVTKIKVNKKKHLIQITGLSSADKQTVKDIKKLTKGGGGLSFTVNPYYVSDKDSVVIKRKKDGSLKSVKVMINGKPYKAKKGEWKQVSANCIEFTGNLAGGYNY